MVYIILILLSHRVGLMSLHQSFFLLLLLKKRQIVAKAEARYLTSHSIQLFMRCKNNVKVNKNTRCTTTVWLVKYQQQHKQSHAYILQ